jgi:hypothetical protein
VDEKFEESRIKWDYFVLTVNCSARFFWRDMGGREEEAAALLP